MSILPIRRTILTVLACTCYRSPPTEDKQPVMLEGEVGEEMYIVVEGSKSVLLERKEETIGWLSSGDFFGELGA